MPYNSDFFTILFADDTTLEICDNNLESLVNNANELLSNAGDWFLANRLTLNAKKTKCILFSPKNLSPPLPIPLKIGKEPIERIGARFKTKSFKLVGIKLDDHLKWDQHAIGVKAKLAKTTYALTRMKNNVPQEIKLTIYNALFRCHLEYGLPIWGQTTSSSRRGIISLQKKAIRTITRAKYNSHTDPIYKRLNILKFDDLYNYSCSQFLFGITLNLHPKTITNVFTKTKNFNRSFDYLKTNVPYSYLQKQIPFSVISVWNKVPRSLRSWLVENFEKVSTKAINNPPLSVKSGNNSSLNKYRVNGFKKAFLQTYIDNYSSSVVCNNTFCEDCSSEN